MKDYSLPSELWDKVLFYVDSWKDLQQCALICSRWKQLVEPHIFSRNIMVEGNSQARALHTYLVRHMEKRYTLKNLKFGYNKIFTLDMQHLMAVAITSSLETLEGTFKDNQFFVILSEIIIQNSLRGSNFNLKIIPSASEYSTAYDTILYYLKDTLVQIQLNFKWVFQDTWTNLYNLDRMPQLSSLSISTEFHTIIQVDRILMKCNRLETLSIYLSLGFEADTDGAFDAWVSQDVDRNLTLTALKVRFGKIYDTRLMDYLMLKYPNIETIVVERKPQDTWKTFNSPELVLDMDDITALLERIKFVAKYVLQCIISKIEIDQLIYMLDLCGYNASLGRQKAVGSFTTDELCVKSDHNINTSDVCRVVKIPPTLHMT